jgi:hypothetical protein
MSSKSKREINNNPNGNSNQKTTQKNHNNSSPNKNQKNYQNTAVNLEAIVKKDLNITQHALAKLKVIAPEKSYAKRMADDFLGMAQAYYEDAKHFQANNDLIRALACVNYAHGWLDAGARLGLFDVKGDDKLFTLAE